MFWNNEIEGMKRDEMISLQTDFLQKQVALAYEKNPFYRKAFDEKGVKPGDIKTIDDMAKLPFTEKNDLRDAYPLGFSTVPPGEIVRIHASSGTTGKPTPVFHTRGDLEHWENCMARNCFTAGVRKEDVCQISFKYTLFTGAFGHHLGVEKIGAMVIPISSGQTEKQILMMKDFGATILHCTPSYAIVIAEKLGEMGLEPGSLKLRLGIHGAEPMSPELRVEIEERLGITAIGDYGLTELGGPGVSIECPEKRGFHINEDYFCPEIINPDTGEQLDEGETGELVFTTLQKEAMPLIRYRTRDITSLDRGRCGCGRTLVRHAPIKGRTDDMMIIGGVNFFPSQLESVLLDSHTVEPHYLIRLRKKGRLDSVCVDVERKPGPASDSDLGEIKESLEKRIRDLIGFGIEVTLVEPGTIQRTEGKAKRVVDER